MLYVHLDQMREALAAEVRNDQDWLGRQIDFGTPQWKAEQIADGILRKQLELADLSDLADLAGGEASLDELLDSDLEDGDSLLDMEDYDVEDMVDLECSLAEDHSGLWDC
jgi:hypothetical protein